mgnify:CR=1 FL=1
MVDITLKSVQGRSSWFQYNTNSKHEALSGEKTIHEYSFESHLLIKENTFTKRTWMLLQIIKTKYKTQKKEWRNVITDYEIEFTGKSYHQGKADFIKIISDFGIQYKKSEKKIKRAFNALKNLDE